MRRGHARVAKRRTIGSLLVDKSLQACCTERSSNRANHYVWAHQIAKRSDSCCLRENHEPFCGAIRGAEHCGGETFWLSSCRGWRWLCNLHTYMLSSNGLECAKLHPRRIQRRGAQVQSINSFRTNQQQESRKARTHLRRVAAVASQHAGLRSTQPRIKGAKCK